MAEDRRHGDWRARYNPPPGRVFHTNASWVNPEGSSFRHGAQSSLGTDRYVRIYGFRTAPSGTEPEQKPTTTIIIKKAESST